MEIVGLDLSTSTCGWSRLNEKNKVLDFGYYDFDKPDQWKNIDLVNQFYENIYPEIENADKVILEDSLKKYKGSFSSRKTITVLLQFNAVVEHELRKKFGRDNLIKIHPATAKKESVLGRGRKPKNYEDSKQWVLNGIGEYYNIEWPRTKFDNIRAQMADVADSIVLASAYINENFN